jgi:hypothetical protein
VAGHRRQALEQFALVVKFAFAVTVTLWSLTPSRKTVPGISSMTDAIWRPDLEWRTNVDNP